MDKAVSEISYNQEVSKELVLVSVPALVEALFLRHRQVSCGKTFSDKARAPVVEERMRELLQCLPVRKDVAVK